MKRLQSHVKKIAEKKYPGKKGTTECTRNYFFPVIEGRVCSCPYGICKKGQAGMRLEFRLTKTGAQY
jgi:hypothetical protein